MFTDKHYVISSANDKIKIKMIPIDYMITIFG